MNKYNILPTLQAIVEKIKNYRNLNLEKVTFVCVQHLVFTTVDLIRSLIILGAKPKNIHVMGKFYSTCSEVKEQMIQMGVVYHASFPPRQLGCFKDHFSYDIKNMWDRISTNIETPYIIVLDDGGQCITNIPEYLNNSHKIYTVEQTSSGISRIKNNNIIFNLINVSYSCAKQFIESPMIAKAVVAKLKKFLPLNSNNFVYGVVGFGAIGSSIIQELLATNQNVIVYDKEIEKGLFLDSFKVTGNIQLLFQEADYIFGCTGTDITVSLDLHKLYGTKYLISCSSQDVEFNSLLKAIRKNFAYKSLNALEDITYPIKGGFIKILKGGYPVNFDNSGQSVPAKNIQLTRGLLFGGIIQAASQLIREYILEPKEEPKEYMLHPKIQKLVIQTLINNLKENIPINNRLLPHVDSIEDFLNEELLKKHSNGQYIDNAIINSIFS